MFQYVLFNECPSCVPRFSHLQHTALWLVTEQKCLQQRCLWRDYRARPYYRRSPAGAFSTWPAPWGPWNPHPQASCTLRAPRAGLCPTGQAEGRAAGHSLPSNPAVQPSLPHPSYPCCMHRRKILLPLACSTVRTWSPQHTWLCAHLLPAESTCFPCFCIPVTPAPFPHLPAPLTFLKALIFVQNFDPSLVQAAQNNRSKGPAFPLTFFSASNKSSFCEWKWFQPNAWANTKRNRWPYLQQCWVLEAQAIWAPTSTACEWLAGHDWGLRKYRMSFPTRTLHA